MIGKVINERYTITDKLGGGDEYCLLSCRFNT